jgi:hypothetical protein
LSEGEHSVFIQLFQIAHEWLNRTVERKEAVLPWAVNAPAAVQNVSGMVGLAERHSLDGIDSSPAISGNPLNLECRRGYPTSTFCVFPQQYWAVLGRFGDNECHRNYFAELS